MIVTTTKNVQESSIFSFLCRSVTIIDHIFLVDHKIMFGLSEKNNIFHSIHLTDRNSRKSLGIIAI